MRHALTWVVTSLLLAGPAFSQVAPSATPPVALPEVNMPSVMTPPPAPAETPATILPAQMPELAAATPAVLPAGVPFSYGEVPYSLMYSPQQAEKMRKILTVYETAKRNNSNAPIQVEEEELDLPPAAIITEPQVYPVFTLRSIAYRDPKDWTVWIGPLRITPRTNQQEVQVTGLTRNNGSFLWKPPYAEALVQRQAQNLFASHARVQHKMTKPNTAVLDQATGHVSFTLRPNQSFVPGYMATFEGSVPAPPLAPLGNAPQTPSGPSPMTVTPGGQVPNLPPDAQKLSPALQKLYQQGTADSVNPTNLDTLLKNQQRAQEPEPTLIAP